METTQTTQLTSVRLPATLRHRLADVSERTRRSRSYLMVAALERYLSDVERDESESTPVNRLELMRQYRGLGVKTTGQARSADEIDSLVRELRGDE